MANVVDLLFDPEVMQAWGTARKIPGYDPNVWRVDALGSWIRFSDYGETTDYGWEKDHRWPVSAGGLTTPSNIQALHWRNNRAKSDNWFF